MSLSKGKGNCYGPEFGLERLGLSRQGRGIVPDQKLGWNGYVSLEREGKSLWTGIWFGTARSLPTENGNCFGPDIGSERSGPSRQGNEIVPDQKLGRNG